MTRSEGRGVRITRWRAMRSGLGGRLSGLSALAMLGLTAGALLVASAFAQLPPAPVEVHHIHGLALDRRDPEVLYVATHTGLVRLRPNAGPEWAGSFFDHATDDGVVYVYVAPPGRGLLRSRDGVGAWEAVGAVVPAGSVAVALAVGPGDHVVVATSKSDIVRSRDGGRTWKAVLEQGRPVSVRQ